MFSKFHKIFDALTDPERQVFQGAAVIFVLSLILNGTNLFYKQTVLAPIEGGSYTEGATGQPSAVNPLLDSGTDIDRDLMELTFSDISELTKDYKSANEGKSWTIELKEGLLWSDGAPLTANDVIFTIEAIQDPETRSPARETWQGVAAEKLNELEVRFTLKIPYAFFLENLKVLKVVPQHIFGAIPASNLRLSDYNLEPVGSGPYAFANYKKRRDGFIEEYTLIANKSYHGEPPLIQEFKFKFFSDPDYSDAVQSFNRREIDAMGGIPAAALDDLKIGYQLEEISVPRYYAVFMNPGTEAAFKQKTVRKALALSIDREKIIKGALSGKAVPVAGPIYPGLEGYAENGSLKKFSPEEARTLLEKDDWKPDDNGILQKKVGSEILRLEFEMVVPRIDFLVEAAKTLSENWRQIGVSVKPIVLSPSEIANEAIKTRNYEMILFGNILKNSPDVFSFWHSSERFYPGLNLALYENKTVDELLESIRRTLDQNARIRDLRKLQEIINDDAPAVFLFSPNYIYVAPKSLGGFSRKLAATPSNRFDEVNKWYLKTARVFKDE